MNIKDVSDQISDESEKHVIGNWKEGDPYHKVAENWDELCSSVGWKVRLVSDELTSLAEISKQNKKSVTWFLLTVYSKM